MQPWPVLLALAASLLQAETLPELRIIQGMIRGVRQRTESGQDFVAFLGIPYALPPTGHLRFKVPIEHPGWTGTLDATQFRSACAQYDSSGEMLGSEDCLHLNVFTRMRFQAPIEISPSSQASSSYPLPMPPYMAQNELELLRLANQRQTYPFTSSSSTSSSTNAPLQPVLVFFHAESFESGDASLYGPEKLLDRDLVLVTLNYRLGVLGFLSTEDDLAPGNLALHDQRLALSWIRKNIAKFGGDPNRVTIAGQGAGAASVFYHLLSRWSSGLFHGVIMQSGSGMCDWARERSPLQFAQQIAKHVGCSDSEIANSQSLSFGPRLPASIQDKIRQLNQVGEMSIEENSFDQSSSVHQSQTRESQMSSKQIVQCLRKVPAGALLKAQVANKIFGEFPQRAAPIVEHHPNGFLIDEPTNLLERTIVNKVPVMMGWNTDEGAYFFPLINALRVQTDISYYQQVLVPRFVEATTAFKGNVAQKALASIINEYFPTASNVNESELAARFVRMATDSMYGSCMEQTATALSSAGLPVHLYQFDYRSSNSMLELLLRLQRENGVSVQHNLQSEPNSMPAPASLQVSLPKLICHGDELFSLFQLKISGLRPPTQLDRLVSAQLTSLWSEFAALNNHSWLFKAGGLWPTFQPKRNYLLLQQSPRVMQYPPQSQWIFWQQLRAKLLKTDTYLNINPQSRNQAQPIPQHQQMLEKTVEELTSSHVSKYATLAFAMIGVSIGLLLLVFLLLAILWYTKRSQSFCANVADGSNSPSLY